VEYFIYSWDCLRNNYFFIIAIYRLSVCFPGRIQNLTEDYRSVPEEQASFIKIAQNCSEQLPEMIHALQCKLMQQGHLFFPLSAYLSLHRLHKPISGKC
jgi:hypothetical protein